MAKQKVLIINTGGTLGMAPSAEGFVPNKNLVTEILSSGNDFSSQELPDYDLHHCEPLIDSSSMNYRYWNEISTLVADNYPNYDGFLVLHGTDTMCYTASALSFALGNLGKPVVITGSQIPLSQFRNDAKENLLHGLLFAATTAVNEVGVYFGHKLLRGNRATKYSTDGFAAFKTPKYHALAEAGVNITLHEKNLLQHTGEDLNVQRFKDSKVALVRLYPNFYSPILQQLASDEACQAVILQVFGKGTMPSEDQAFMSALQMLIASDKPIIVCSQCLQAKIDLACYEAIRPLFNAGAISAQDMTTEATVVKAQFLLSVHTDSTGTLDTEAFEADFLADLAGELTAE